MRLVVPICIASCTGVGCGVTFTWAEFDRLDTIEVDEREEPGQTRTHKSCDQCGTRVTVIGFGIMKPALLWRDWEEHRQFFPDSRRKPVMLPETSGDRVRLWLWRPSWSRTCALLVLAAVVLALIVRGLS